MRMSRNRLANGKDQRTFRRAWTLARDRFNPPLHHEASLFIWIQLIPTETGRVCGSLGTRKYHLPLRPRIFECHCSHCLFVEYHPVILSYYYHLNHPFFGHFIVIITSLPIGFCVHLCIHINLFVHHFTNHQEHSGWDTLREMGCIY